MGALESRVHVEDTELGIEESCQATVHVPTKVLEGEDGLRVLNQNIAGWRNKIIVNLVNTHLEANQLL